MDGAWTYLMSRHLKIFLWFCQNIWWAVHPGTHLKGFFLSPHTQPSPLAIESTTIALIVFLVALFINLWKYLSKPTFIKCFKLVSFSVGMCSIVHWVDKTVAENVSVAAKPFWRPQSLAKNCDRYLFWINGFIAPPENYWNQKDFQWLVEHQGKARKCQCESHPQASHQPSQVSQPTCFW